MCEAFVPHIIFMALSVVVVGNCARIQDGGFVVIFIVVKVFKTINNVRR